MSQFRPTVQNKRTGSAGINLFIRPRMWNILQNFIASLGSIGGAGSISDEQFRAAFEAIPDLHVMCNTNTKLTTY